MNKKLRPTIKSTVPVFGEGSIERSLIEKLAPAFDNIFKNINMLHQRLSRLEAIGPGVQINYTATSVDDLKDAIAVIAPNFEFNDEWSEEPEGEKANDNTSEKAA